jgi:hypothetical protein
MSLLIPLVGGFSAKLYDDIDDNPLLRKFRNKTFIEFLKGLHFISFTTVSIYEPLFFILSYLSNMVNCASNPIAYSKSYEHSLGYSFLLLFFIIDYQKIKWIGTIDMIMVVTMIIATFIEPIIMTQYFKNSEFSFTKMIFRMLILNGMILFCLLSTSTVVQYFFAYFIGYFL